MKMENLNGNSKQLQMKNRNNIFLFIIILFCAVTSKAQNKMQDSLRHYNKMLSPIEMKEDLQILFDIRKQANSGLYVYRTPQQIDSIFNWAFKEVKSPLSTIDFYKILVRLADFEGSCHNYTAPDNDLLDFLKRQKSFFPDPLIYMEGQIIFDGQNSAIPAGSRILSINGITDEELMKSFFKYYPTDGFTQTTKLSASVNKSFGINYLLEYGLTDVYETEYVEPQSKNAKKIKIPAVTLEQRTKNEENKFSGPVSDLIDFNKQEPYSFEMINPATGRLNLRWFGMVSGEEDPGFEKYVGFIDSVFVELANKNIPNLIIDVRNNPGGADPTFELPVMYLSDYSFKENLTACIVFDPYDIPLEKYFWGVSMDQAMDSTALALGKEFLKDRFPVYKNGLSYQNQKYNPVYTPKTPKFKGDIFMLINENVASAASHFASLVKAYVNYITIVGVETRGGYYEHNGHSPLIYELPNSKIKSQFSIVHLIQDAPKKVDQPEGSGIIPDYEIWPTLKDFFEHKDTQLEFVLQLIDK